MADVFGTILQEIQADTVTKREHAKTRLSQYLSNAENVQTLERAHDSGQLKKNLIIN